MEQQDLLQDLEQEIYLERASTGARFANYLIDIIGYSILLWIIFVLVAILIVPTTIKADENFSIQQNQDEIRFFVYIISYLSYLIYYTIFEGATKGRTLGKLITGTRAVNMDGTPITWKDAFIRSLIRLIPFEQFSALGNAWHDKWSDTQVIKVRK
jgi:uncharacterized RDD family membrane protein YckC